MYRKTVYILASAALLLALATATFAQVTGGSVTGSVLDVNSAAVENATVTLRNKATGQELTTQSTGAGSFGCWARNPSR